MSFLSNKTIELRALEPSDLDFLYKHENESYLREFGDNPMPNSKFILKRFIKIASRDFWETRQLRLVITSLDDESILGCVDLFEFDPHAMRAGVGIFIIKEEQNKGYASEALEIFSEYALDVLGLNQLYAHIAVENKPSIQLFTKVGYKQAGCLKAWQKINDKYVDVNILQKIKSS